MSDMLAGTKAGVRQPGGGWTEFSAKIPSDTASLPRDDDAVRAVKLSTSEDKPSKQISLEVGGRKLQNIVSELYPQHRFYFAREDWKTSSNWISIAMVTPNPDKSVTIEWNVKSPL